MKTLCHHMWIRRQGNISNEGYICLHDGVKRIVVVSDNMAYRMCGLDCSETLWFVHMLGKPRETK